MSIDIGTRVTAVNSFQLKGQEGVVKFVGEVPGKVGIHVGVELDVYNFIVFKMDRTQREIWTEL